MLRTFDQPEIREDFVVILQKATSKDPSGCLAVIDSSLIEQLHSELASEDNSEATQFLKQNITSILRNIATD